MSWRAIKEFFKPDWRKIIIFALLAIAANLPFVGTYNPHLQFVRYSDRGVEHTWNLTLYEPNPLLYAPFVISAQINCKLNQNCTKFLLPEYPLLNQLIVIGESLKWYLISPAFFQSRYLTGSIYFIGILLLYWYLLSSLIVFILRGAKRIKIRLLKQKNR